MITGTGATSVTDSNGVTLNVNATALANNTALTLVGSAAETVTGLVGNIAAGSLTGALTVTTGDAADNGISITTGSAATSITASGAGDIVTVTATALAQNTALTLAGSAAETVTGLVGNHRGRLSDRCADSDDPGMLGTGISITTGSAVDLHHRDALTADIVEGDRRQRCHGNPEYWRPGGRPYSGDLTVTVTLVANTSRPAPVPNTMTGGCGR